MSVDVENEGLGRETIMSVEVENERVGGVKGSDGSVYGRLTIIAVQFVKDVEETKIEGDIEQLGGTEIGEEDGRRMERC